MEQTILEHLREKSINELFNMSSFSNVWTIWRQEIRNHIGSFNSKNVINLGDSLSDVFFSTRQAGRDQSYLSGGGAAWEALVTWYLNLCLLESRTVVIKQNKELLPTPIKEAITVNYGNFPSNTESDLIAITFPDKDEYTKINKFSVGTRDNQGNLIDTRLRNGNLNYKHIIDSLSDRDFNSLEIGIIQCKTNWNDNAQIPMLWDMVYSSVGFTKRNLTVGTSSYSIRNIKRFTYSFVTVPTVKLSNFKTTSTSVRRVQNISGGNYWGFPSKSSIANSIKDIFSRNFPNGSSNNGLKYDLDKALSKLENDYSYFNI